MDGKSWNGHDMKRWEWYPYYDKNAVLKHFRPEDGSTKI